MSAAGPSRPRLWRRRWFRRVLLLACLLAAYPAFVLGTVYTITLRSDLPGGRNGPRDAYRHSLASAVVAYTGWRAWVDWVTELMEGEAQRASRRMDVHNNRIGAHIGATAVSWSAMLQAVRAAVDAGTIAANVTAIDAATDRIVWLPTTRWGEQDW